jgi:gliding-associated putative ABC transporter substrate-binding component GldG
MLNLFKKSGRIVQLLIVTSILVAVNLIANYFYTAVDLTDDNRYSISKQTKQIVASLEDNITVKVLLDGDFPAGFKRLQASTLDILRNFRDINSNIIFEFEDPTSGTPEEKEQKRKRLVDDGIVPISLSYSDGNQVVQKPVFPFAVVYYANKKQVINLLEEQKPGDDEDAILNKSVSLLEYKFANAFKRIQTGRKRNILFTQGNGEWDNASTFRLESELRMQHVVGRVALDSLLAIDSTIDIVIVAGPRNAISPQNLFKLDQYIMAGGKIIWLLDKFHVSLDSISKNKFYIPTPTEFGVDDLLFKYGVRIVPDLVMDLECSAIPQVVGMMGDKPQTKLFPWAYHPVVAPQGEHPIVKNIDRVNLSFPSTIDTIRTDAAIKKTILLKSSNYSRNQLAPMRLTFEILKTSPDPSKFRDGNRPLAVLLEGEFESMFVNRITPEQQELLNRFNLKFRSKSKNTCQLVVSDSDFAKNLVNLQSGATEDIGYNKWERRHYKGNKEFISNAVDYMMDPENILVSRSKEIKLRMLDPVKAKEQKGFWQWINVGMPVVILALFGFSYRFWRRRKYASNQ